MCACLCLRVRGTIQNRALWSPRGYLQNNPSKLEEPNRTPSVAAAFTVTGERRRTGLEQKVGCYLVIAKKNQKVLNRKNICFPIVYVNRNSFRLVERKKCCVPRSETLRLLNVSLVGLDRRGANTSRREACLRSPPRPPRAGCCVLALKPGDLR